jgi:pyruvate,water dikinase
LNTNIDFCNGDILVTDMTDPDWEPIMTKASAIITNKGGRTCHAAIIARELGITAIVGTNNCTDILKDDQR